MAIRSTDKGVRMPSAPEFFVPNFDILNQTLARNQVALDQYKDQASNIQLQAMTQDARRRAQLLQEVDQGIDKNAETFMKQGVQAGLADLSQRKRALKKLMQPGGEGYEINENFKRYTDFVNSVKDQVNKGKIDANTGEQAIKYYNTQFGGTVLDPATGAYTRFTHDPLAETVNPDDLVEEWGKGYEEEMASTGWSKIRSDGYIWKFKNKRGEVKEVDVRDDLLGALQRHTGLQSYLNQQELFQLMTPEKRRQYILDAANRGGRKFGYVRTENESYIQGASEELKQRHRKSLEKYKQDLADYAVTSVIGLNKPLRVDPKTLQPAKYEIEASGYFPIEGAFTSKKTPDAPTLKGAIFDTDVAYAYKEAMGEGWDDNLAAAQTLVNRGILNQNSTEEEFLNKTAEYMQSSANSRNAKAFKRNIYSDDKQKSETQRLFGYTKDKARAIDGISATVYVETPNGLKEMTAKQAEEEFNLQPESFAVTGELTENSLHPNSLAVHAENDDGETYTMFLTGINQQYTEQYAPYTDLIYGGTTLPTGESIERQIGEFQFRSSNEEIIGPDGKVVDIIPRYEQLTEDGYVPVRIESIKKYMDRGLGRDKE